MSETSTPIESAKLQTPALRWKKLLAVWVFAAAALAALLVNNAALDTWTWCATRWFVGDRDYYTWEQYKAANASNTTAPFYAKKDPPAGSKIYKRTDSLWETLKAFGEGWIVLIVAGAIWVYHRYKWAMAGAAFLAMAIAGGLGALIRICDGRFRPTHHDGANTWELFRGFHDGKDLSFPSGHATLAFAAAAVLTYLSPRGKVVFISVATGTAISRVVMGAHFWSDAIFGAALGWTVGTLVIAFADRAFAKIEAGKNRKSVSQTGT